VNAHRRKQGPLFLPPIGLFSLPSASPNPPYLVGLMQPTAWAEGVETVAADDARPQSQLTHIQGDPMKARAIDWRPADGGSIKRRDVLCPGVADEREPLVVGLHRMYRASARLC
jgi:hypothetical protein